ncbi:hypothetical protein ACIBJD_30660, partial [Kitasatospora sp. NPDC050467]
MVRRRTSPGFTPAAGAAPTDGTTVTMQDTLPAGLAADSISGTGWTCDQGTLTCTRSGALPAGSGYPPITLQVAVSCRAGGEVTNTATVTGGDDTTSHTATDPTTIKAPQARHVRHALRPPRALADQPTPGPPPPARDYRAAVRADYTAAARMGEAHTRPPGSTAAAPEGRPPPPGGGRGAEGAGARPPPAPPRAPQPARRRRPEPHPSR